MFDFNILSRTNTDLLKNSDKNSPKQNVVILCGLKSTNLLVP